MAEWSGPVNKETCTETCTSDAIALRHHVCMTWQAGGQKMSLCKGETG